MECYACDREADGQCQRCGNPFCAEHGSDKLCQTCQSPTSVLPSSATYRGSVLVLLLGGILALWLLVQPPDLPSDSGGLAPLPTQGVEFTPQPRTSPVPTQAPSPAPSATPSPTAAVRQYTVRDGDTLLSIAETTSPPGVDAFTYAQQIAAANSIDFVTPDLQVGQMLTLP